MLTAAGSSPLTRGKPPTRAAVVSGARLIPAHAGKTRSAASFGSALRAHPRSRGENELSVRRCSTGEGSSPLTRGKQVLSESHTAGLGLIPAHAGKTVLGAITGTINGAHPRSRGENAQVRAVVVRHLGSSPLTRGKPTGRRESSCTRGLIPAHAGKTARNWTPSVESWAHPRSRGENAPNEGYEAKVSGSSPLTRGKLGCPILRVARGGLIPAHAGKTQSDAEAHAS